MKMLRPLLVLALLIILVAAVMLWWNRPVRVDMAEYVPADSLVYLELNSFDDVAKAIQETDAWKASADVAGLSTVKPSSTATWAAKSGIGPVEAVVTTRAQIALAIIGIDTSTQEDAVRIKPEVAVVIETKTASWRVKSAVLKNLTRLANFAYGSANCNERNDGAQLVECAENRGQRKLIGAIDGSVVIIGNSDKAVQTCLGVRHGQRPSLHTDQEFLNARSSLKGESSLAFGYVSPASSAKLFSWGAPLLLGKEPGDTQLEHLLSESAAKIFRGIAWTSNASGGRIEDRYQISLDQEVVRRLGPAFERGGSGNDFMKLLPDAFRSLTIYRSKDPQAAWFSLDSAVAMKLDAVSSVLFASLLKSSLGVYGIENPREFLAALAPPLITVRPVLGENSFLVARVKDEAKLRSALSTDLLTGGKGQLLTGYQTDPSKENEFAAVFIDGFIVLGKSENIAIYLAQLRNKEMIRADHLKSLEAGEPAPVTSFTNEGESTLAVISVLAMLRGRTLSTSQLEEIRKRLNNIDISRTESTLNSSGIERRSESTFGQFGSLLSLAQADSSPTSSR